MCTFLLSVQEDEMVCVNRTFASTALMKSWAPWGTARLILELGHGELLFSKMGSFEMMLKCVASRVLPPNGVNPVSSS